MLDPTCRSPAASLHVAMATVNPQAIGTRAFRTWRWQARPARRPSRLGWSLFKTVLLVGCTLASAGAARADAAFNGAAACEAAGQAVRSMSTAQRERFSQTGQTAAPCAVWSADAAPPAARRESVHLQLFNGPGSNVVSPNPYRSLASRVTEAPPPQRPALSGAVARAVELSPAVDAAARRHNIDPLLLHAIAHVESRHDPRARSHAGALGVMQVMPGTGQRFGVADRAALHDVPTNLEVSAVYLKTLQDRFGNDLPLVLAAYNAGEGAVERHGRRVPPYAETRRYVADVMAIYQRLGATARQVRGRAPPRSAAGTL